MAENKNPKESKRPPQFWFYAAVVFFVLAGVTLAREYFFERSSTQTEKTETQTQNIEPPLAEQTPPTPETIQPEKDEFFDKIVLRGKLVKDEVMVSPFLRAGVSQVEAEAVLAALKGLFDFRKARPDNTYNIIADKDGKVTSFTFQAGPIDIYHVAKEGNEFKGSKEPITPEVEITTLSGTIKSSIYEALEDAHEDLRLAAAIADVFAYDIDFYADCREGDTFHIIYERKTYKGELIEVGRVYAAAYQGSYIGIKTIYYNEKKNSYYDYNGTAATKAFLRSPLKFTRISSRFGKRLHPILRKWHFHGGVDYAAPAGTPVQAVGDGVVTFVGNKGPAGNMVAIKHQSGYESNYLHLSKTLVKEGQKVTQKTVIGNVGSTGRSTGPHLDFRLKHNGKYLNPLRHVAPRTPPLSKLELEQFRKNIEKWHVELEKLNANAHADITSPLPNN